MADTDIVIEIVEAQPIEIEIDSISAGTGLPNGTETGQLLMWNNATLVWELTTVIDEGMWV